MPLRIQKYVQVENFRLQMFYRFLQLGIIVPLSMYFIATEQYSKPLSLKEHVFIDSTVTGWQNPTLLAQAAAEKAMEPWCKFPSDYNFLGDFLSDGQSLRDQAFRFENHQCSTICSANNNSSGCLHPPDIWIQEQKNEFLLLTSLRDTTYHSHGMTSSQAYLLPFAEILAVAFKVAFRELDKSLFATARSVVGGAIFSTDLQHPTKFESSCGTVIKEIAPGADLVLSVPELFSIVCMEGYLDRIQTSAGTNSLSGAKHPDGALGRIVGAEITISVFINADEKSAVVKATLSPLAFVGGSLDEASATGLRFRQYNGIRIRFVADGIQTVFDINNVLLNLSALVVYLSIPIIFIRFWAVYALGHLSKIYRNVIYSKFSISKECGAMATRLMGSNALFNQLGDVKDADGDGVADDAGISRDRMAEYIRDVMQHRGNIIDEHEICQFVELAFNEVDIGQTHDEAHTFFGNIVAAIKDYLDIADIHREHDHRPSQPFDRSSSRISQGGPGVRTIDIDEFNTAFLSAFPISFASVVKLFDKDKHHHFLENFFMPHKLKNALLTAKLIEMMKREGRDKSLLDLGLMAGAGTAGAEDADSGVPDLLKQMPKKLKIIETPERNVYTPERNVDSRIVEAPGVPSSQPEIISQVQDAGMMSWPSSDIAGPANDKTTSRFDASFSRAQMATHEAAGATNPVVVRVQNSNRLSPGPHVSENRLPPSEAVIDLTQGSPRHLPRIAHHDVSPSGFVQMNEEALHRLREAARLRKISRERFARVLE